MPLPDKCAAQLPINAVVAEVDFGGGPVPIFPICGLTRHVDYFRVAVYNRPQAAESLQIGPFHVRVVGLPWLGPSQTPQSARREDEGEAPEPAERPECPDEEEAAGGLGDLAVM
jgi:hypothetical protein